MRDERKETHTEYLQIKGRGLLWFFLFCRYQCCNAPLSFHILYKCVNFVVQLWLEWRLPAVGRKVAATTSVANSATISARPVLFFFSAQGDHFRQTKVKHPIILVHPYHTCTTSKYQYHLSDRCKDRIDCCCWDCFKSVLPSTIKTFFSSKEKQVFIVDNAQRLQGCLRWDLSRNISRAEWVSSSSYELCGES